jgi:hypothetical protein
MHVYVDLCLPGIPARNGFIGFLLARPGDQALLSPSPKLVSADQLSIQLAANPQRRS